MKQNFKIHNKIKEILEFAQNERESTQDLFEMIADCNFEELRVLCLISQNLNSAIQKVNWVKELNTILKPKKVKQIIPQ